VHVHAINPVAESEELLDELQLSTSEFRLLGPFEVWRAGQQLAVGGAKPRALLAVLLLHADHVVSTDQLIEALWGEHPPASAANALQAHSSGFCAALATGYPVRMIPAPAALPVAEVVRRLNEAQPPVLLARTSKLVTLAAERRAGRLRIEPRAITAMGETVTAEDRGTIEASFGIPLVTQFVFHRRTGRAQRPRR
jgi:hypothetical protein